MQEWTTAPIGSPVGQNGTVLKVCDDGVLMKLLTSWTLYTHRPAFIFKSMMTVNVQKVNNCKPSYLIARCIWEQEHYLTNLAYELFKTWNKPLISICISFLLRGLRILSSGMLQFIIIFWNYEAFDIILWLHLPEISSFQSHPKRLTQIYIQKNSDINLYLKWVRSHEPISSSWVCWSASLL